ncbi:hypothetical protein [Aequorivita capsosiphonis]|uniref:hypothetical protein n=1 Tax=Aequorivita capsosiphonis TaxID=487317 RepID=UPI00040D15F1|nr:hypothetical protein [Aequorivita capsosiphonis]
MFLAKSKFHLFALNVNSKITSIFRKRPKVQIVHKKLWSLSVQGKIIILLSSFEETPFLWECKGLCDL